MAFLATCSLKSISPLSFSRYYEVEKLDKESPDAFEQRTWRERCHYDEQEMIYIPPMSFKKTITEAAEYSPKKIKGQRNATYTKHIRAGIVVQDPVPLGIAKKDVQFERVFVPSDGKPGGTVRVMKYFPVINSWTGTALFHILDPTVTQAVFEETLYEAGQFIGIGRFRPIRGGYYGRFGFNGKGIDWRKE